MKLWCNISALNRAAHACIKHKRSRSDAVAFRMHWGEEILSLARRLESGKYQPEAGKVFVTSRPKHREIHAAAFRDRVVHHLLYGLLEPYFEARFIADSYACRKGKGTHAAVRRLQQMMWNITRHGKVSAFALKMDIKSFFPSIHKPTLFGFLQKAKTELTDESFWKLVKTVVFNNAAASAIPCSPAWRFQQVPHHKRLGSKGSDYGLPIGNLTSQFFANVYLNNLDYFVKRTLAARYYVRYVDDFVLLHNSPQTLKIWKNKIENFLKIHLQLEAHEAEEIHCVGRGVDFVGYIVRPKYLLPRRRTVANLNKHVTQQEAALCPKVVLEEQHVDLHQVGSVKGPCKIQPIEYGRLEKLRATWASYEGHFRHCNAFGLRMRIWKKHPLSKSILHQGLRVTRRFALPKFAASLNEQCTCSSLTYESGQDF